MKDTLNEDDVIIKGDNGHYKVIIPLLIFLIFTSIGYSYLSTGLKLTGSLGIPKMSWDVHFDNIVEDIDNNIIPTNPATITSNNTRIAFNIELVYPKDRYGFSVDIINEGTLDAMLEGYTINGVSSEQEDYITYVLTYEDGTSIEEKDLLKAGEKVTIHFFVKYNEILFDDDQYINMVIDFNYIQADDTAIERG